MDDVCFYYPIKLNQELENHVIPLSLGKWLIDSIYFWSDVSASRLKYGQTVIQSSVPTGREGAAAKDTNDAVGEETDRHTEGSANWQPGAARHWPKRAVYDSKPEHS